MGANNGALIHCYSTGEVSGEQGVGGLVGTNSVAIANCYSSGIVSGDQKIGGLVGENEHYGSVVNCYCTGDISGQQNVAGFAAVNSGSVSNCYSISAVPVDEQIGGFVASNDGSVSNCFWDTDSSNQATSEGGIGRRTNQMKNANTYSNAGWDFVDEELNGTSEVWQMTAPSSYPQLSVFTGYEPLQISGEGTLDAPYLIANAQELGTVYHRPHAYYQLAATVDLQGIEWSAPVVPLFYGVFDGNNLTVTNLRIRGSGHLGVFGTILYGAQVENLGVENVDLVGAGNLIGGLAGYNYYGLIVNCYSTGNATGDGEIGGLLGENFKGQLDFCNSQATATGGNKIAGLVGNNYRGILNQCYSTGAASGELFCGGLVGTNYSGLVNECYSKSSVEGSSQVGGLVGGTTSGSLTKNCYSAGTVSGTSASGGLLGANSGNVLNSYSIARVLGSGFSIGGLIGNGNGSVNGCFWNKTASGQTQSDGGTGKTTTQMKSAGTFLSAGWDFMDETNNGTEDIWWILAGPAYPRLWWELLSEN